MPGANRLRKEKFNPLAPGVRNKYQLRKAIGRRTQGVIRPKLNALKEQGVEEGQAHEGRMRDLSGMYNYYGDKLSSAYARASEALDKVLASTGASDQASQGALLAALEQSRAADRSQANAVGGVLPQGSGADTVTAAAGAGNASLANLANMFGQNINMAAGRIGTGALARTRGLSTEDERYAAIREKLQKERQDVKQSIPSVREEQRKNILDEELARAAERERENIARGSLHLEGKKQKETERSNRVQEQIAWAGIRLEKEKIQKEINGAGSEAEKEAAEARGEEYNRGVEVFQGYFEKTKPKAYDPQSLFRSLTLTTSPEVALKIMEHGPARFKNWAIRRWNKRHGHGEENTGEKKGPPNPKTGKVGP